MKRSYETSVLLPIPHIVQTGDWDCGLACFQMVMRYVRPSMSYDDVNAACNDHGIVRSVWTIDLAYLCAKLGVCHKFYTQTFGVNKDYTNESFYNDGRHFDYTNEERRVNALFKKHDEHNVKVIKQSVGIERILEHLRKKQPIIVLINGRMFLKEQERDNEDEALSNCNLCFGCFPCRRKRTNSSTAILSSNTDNGGNDDGYWGHFVVVIGYNRRKKIFILNDPSPDGKHVECSFQTLDRSRQSFGTDEDILFVYCNDEEIDS